MNEKTSLTPGTLVKLKSSGPVMTVSTVTADGRVVCLWFDGRSKLQRATLSTAVVTIMRG